MKTCRLLISVFAATIFFLSFASQTLALDDPPTAFSYQGQLTSSGQPVNDTCNFRFSLWDAFTGGSRVVPIVEATNVPIRDGVFTVTPDFGIDPFIGEPLWLNITVDCGDGMVELSPRQQIMSAPYAITAFTLNGLRADDFWKLGGNSGTTPGDDFVGTTDNQALELHVDSTRVLRLEPAKDIGNFIAGAPANSVMDDVFGASIGGGGGTLGLENTVWDDYGTVAGGAGNWVGNRNEDTDDAWYTTVGGGRENSARAGFATVAGGTINIANSRSSFIGGGTANSTEGSSSVVVGGEDNSADGNFATVGGGQGNMSNGQHATVSGGGENFAMDNNTVVGGGANNVAGSLDGNTENAEDATVAGGNSNLASKSAATVGGGISNSADGFWATVSGGWHNQALAEFATIGGGGTIDPITDPEGSSNRVYDAYGVIAGGGGNWAGDNDGDQFTQKFATVGGGQSNGASDEHATVGGGAFNSASNTAATVGGGQSNRAVGAFATVPGGKSSHADGDYSFAAGLEAQALHDGAFVWADASDEPFASTRSGQFRVRANGGVEFETGKEGLRVSADSILYLSPHDMVIRGSSGVILRPLDNGGTRALLDVGAATQYISLPVSTFGVLFGSPVYVKSLRVCYRTNSASLAYITATAVIKNNSGTGTTFYFNNATDRQYANYHCYNITAATPRKAIDNSSWVQFNMEPGQTGDYVEILTVALTLSEYQSE